MVELRKILGQIRVVKSHGKASGQLVHWREVPGIGSGFVEFLTSS